MELLKFSSILAILSLFTILHIRKVQSYLTLTILHTNDVHARVEETNRYGAACTTSECYGGVARRFTKIQEIRSNHDNVILMDAGDQFQGTLWFNYYKGNATRYFMDLLEYDVMTLGNHEFDDGVAGLTPFLEGVNFPVVSANINASKLAEFEQLFTPSTVLDVNGFKVGVIGYIIETTPQLVAKEGIEGLQFTSIIESVRSEVQRLTDEGVSIIIALGHAGYEADLQLAKEVTGLDLVVGGHTNTFLYNGDPPSIEQPVGPYPQLVTQQDGKVVPVVQAYTFGKYLGYLNLTFDDNGNVLSWKGNPIVLDVTVEQDPGVLAAVETWLKPLEELKAKKVGESAVFLDGQGTTCRVKECNMGNMATDAMVNYYLHKLPAISGWANVSIAIWNSGGIRVSIEKGPITMENVMVAFPFRNTIQLIEVQGRTLLSILEHSVSNYNELSPSGGFLQFSGMKVKFDLTREAGDRVKSVDVLCAECDIPSYFPLEPADTYSLLINDYLIGGGDGYDMIASHLISRLPLEDLLTDVVVGYLSGHVPVTSGVEGRIEFSTDTALPTQLPTQLPTCSAASLLLTTISPINIILILILSLNK